MALVGNECNTCGEGHKGHRCPYCDQKLMRGFFLMAKNMAALIPKLPGGTPGITDFGRAGGDCICKKCGLPYIEHPMGMETWLHLLCDGKQVKL